MTLIAHYPLQEDSGSTAYDATGNGNDGTVNGATLNATGLLGTSAYSLDGTDDYVNSPLQPDYAYPFSYAYWFENNDPANANDGVFHASNGAGDDTLGTKISSGQIELSSYDGANNTSYSFSAGDVPADTWTHAATIYTGSEYVIYQDGEEVGRTSSTFEPAVNYDAPIGARNTAGTIEQFFSGRIADLRLYDHALTTSEVSKLYETTRYAYQTTEAKTL